MAAILRFLNGSGSGRSVQVRESAVAVCGRDPNCDVQLDSERVSRRHFELRLNGGTLHLHNLSATNPVYVNGETRTECELLMGDLVAAGGISLRVQSLDSVTRPRLPIPGLERLPELDNREQYHALLQCVLSIQSMLVEDGANLIERSIGMVFIAIPATRLALFTVRDDGTVEQGYTAFAGKTNERRLSHGLARKVLEAGHAILLEEVQDSQVKEYGNTLREHDVQCAVGVPVMVSGRIVAVLIGDNLERPGAITEDHAQVLEFAAFALAWAWQRDHLRALEAQQLQTERQLSAARLVQERICNKALDCAVGDVHWAVAYRPALELGGDFYDVQTDGQNITWVHADVCGKGVPAALVVSMLRAFCKPLLQRKLKPLELLRELDRLLQGEIPEYMFATAAVVQASGRELEWCSVGHPPAILVPERGEPTLFDPTPGAIGLASRPLSEVAITPRRHILAPGERFCLITDGVQEAPDADGNQYEIARTITSLRCSSTLAPAVQVADLIADVLHFSGGEQHDDITVILAQG